MVPIGPHDVRNVKYGDKSDSVVRDRWSAARYPVDAEPLDADVEPPSPPPPLLLLPPADEGVL